jgi:hypothetical protein
VIGHQQEQVFQLSDLEAWILGTVDNIGWYAYLWFPVVYREVLNFGDDSPDEVVPQWKPAPRALTVAQEILRSKFGWPDSYTPPSRTP